MRVIGVRASTRHFRYSVLESSGSKLNWINLNEEHKWIVPKCSTTKAAVLSDVYKEIVRLISKYKPDIVAMKVAETPRGNPDPNRVSVEAAIVLAAAHTHVEVRERRYRELKTNSSEVGDLALSYVTKPASQWDLELADALVAGLRELGL